jgi:hypothetical protein
MSLYPAKGRVMNVLGHPKFKCSRCGSPASAFFDVRDMNDKRAVDRLIKLEEAERLRKQVLRLCLLQGNFAIIVYRTYRRKKEKRMKKAKKQKTHKKKMHYLHKSLNPIQATVANKVGNDN